MERDVFVGVDGDVMERDVFLGVFGGTKHTPDPSSAGLPLGDRTVISLGGNGQSAPLRCVGALLCLS